MKQLVEKTDIPWHEVITQGMVRFSCTCSPNPNEWFSEGHNNPSKDSIDDLLMIADKLEIMFIDFDYLQQTVEVNYTDIWYTGHGKTYAEKLYTALLQSQGLEEVT